MSIVFLPSSKPESQFRFAHSINRGVKISEIEKMMDPRSSSELKRNCIGDTIGAWGFASKNGSPNISKWCKISPGDRVVFYKQGRLFYTGRVAAKTDNAKLAEKLWGFNDEGGTWQLMFFITDCKPINVDISPEMLGYDPKYTFQSSQIYLTNSDKYRVLNKMIP